MKYIVTRGAIFPGQKVISRGVRSLRQGTESRHLIDTGIYLYYNPGYLHCDICLQPPKTALLRKMAIIPGNDRTKISMKNSKTPALVSTIFCFDDIKQPAIEKKRADGLTDPNIGRIMLQFSILSRLKPVVEPPCE
ncbi:hypothetical protein [Sodalis praecaptivus]|uniref:hypothetical protein n=1 Tax=Sodalis TaxID=84565 RepID=UPI0011DE2862|nr:hypothetical protein [Sodalis praecaptivus]